MMEVALQIPVIAVLRHQEPLVESATASLQARRPTIPFEATRTPRGFTLDPRIPAIPIGSASVTGTTAESLQPDQSENFAVRGLIEAEDAQDIPPEVDGQAIFADPAIAPFVTCGGNGPVGTAQTVAQQLRVPDLANHGLDGADVAIAIMDTGINLNHLRAKLGVMPRFDAANSWKVPGTTTMPGQHPVNHGTMCAYDALIAAPNATLLDFPILNNNAPGGSTMAGTLSVALLGFAQLMSSWAVSFAPGGLHRYKALVVNNSWGIFHPSWDFPAGHPGRFCDNPNHPFNIIVGTLARTNVDIVFAAGNCGAQCADMRCAGRVTEAIMGASAHSDVLTLAGCDTMDQRVG
jgi:subtilisin family serine protease